MPRKHRIWFPESIHHITSRGIRRNNIFNDNQDYKVYLSILKEVKVKFTFELYCYCLMTNHVHLQVKTIDISISDIMKRINQIYAQYFNKKYNYTGHLFQDRYYSEVIKDTAQMLSTTRYIHLNPVRANIVKRPEEYDYSCYSMYIGMKKDLLISPERILSFFQGSNNRMLYKEFVESDMELKINIK